jgi:hypothetical protein
MNKQTSVIDTRWRREARVCRIALWSRLRVVEPLREAVAGRNKLRMVANGLKPTFGDAGDQLFSIEPFTRKRLVTGTRIRVHP